MVLKILLTVWVLSFLMLAIFYFESELWRRNERGE
jgi:hypothetical protein